MRELEEVHYRGMDLMLSSRFLVDHMESLRQRFIDDEDWYKKLFALAMERWYSMNLMDEASFNLIHETLEVEIYER